MLPRICITIASVLSAVGLPIILASAGMKTLENPPRVPPTQLSNRESVEITTLNIGSTIRQTTSSTAPHSYRIAMSRGHYLGVNVSRLVHGCEVLLYGADGSLVTQGVCRARGLTPISLVAEASGNYRVEVRAVDNRPRTYNLDVVGIRPSTIRDIARITAEKLC